MVWQSIFIITGTIIIVVADQQQQRIVAGPIDTKARLGAVALLTCRVSQQKGAVQWVKGGLGLGDDRQLPEFPRYTMSGSSSDGEFNLQIDNVQMTDDDEYQCQVAAADIDGVTYLTQKSAKARLSVLVTPQFPQFVGIGTDDIDAIESRPLTISCSSDGGKPQAELLWAIADRRTSLISRWLGDSRAKMTARFGGKVQSAPSSSSADVVITESVRKHSDTKLFMVTSNITFTPEADDEDKAIVCLAIHETLSTPMNVSRRLRLQYAPKVRVNLTVRDARGGGGGRLREGSGAVLACEVDAKPMIPLRIRWFRNGTTTTFRSDSDTIQLVDLRMQDNGLQYTCEATNLVGIGNASIILDVAFAPRIISNEQKKAVEIGSAVTFACDTIGNPTPHIEWTKAGYPNRILSTSSNLTIRSVTNADRGEYHCKASVDGFKSELLKAFLYLRGPPSVTVTERVKAAPGETVELVCQVRGFPEANDIFWYRGGIQLDNAQLGDRYHIRSAGQPYGAESVLTIKELRHSDFNEYNCTATNVHGTHSMKLDLVANDAISMYLIIPGVILISLILLIVLLILLLKRQQLCRSKSSRYDDHSDVTVKVEALDRYCQLSTDAYSATPPIDCNDLSDRKDNYMAVPQHNPDYDLDFLPPPNGYNSSRGFWSSGNSSQTPFIIAESPISDYRYDAFRCEPMITYGSFQSVQQQPVIDIYNNNNGAVFAHPSAFYPSDTAMLIQQQQQMPVSQRQCLETLTEMPTPDNESSTTPLFVRMNNNGPSPIVHRGHHNQHQQLIIDDRPNSRSSTHV